MKSTRIAIAVLIFMIMASVYAAAPVMRMLPAANAVKGFKIVSRSLQYAKGNDLTNIYDGGFELYTKNGVVDAARQLYQKKSDYVEITIHTMKSDKAATDFLRYWQKSNKIKKMEKVGSSTGFITSKPAAAAYFIKHKVFYTVTALSSNPKATQDVKAFVTAIDKRIK